MDSENDDKDLKLATRHCPICGKPASFAERPFCSRRCADIDLHRWFSGTYAVPAQPDAAADENAPIEGETEQK
jgi:uncharacterized protein